MKKIWAVVMALVGAAAAVVLVRLNEQSRLCDQSPTAIEDCVGPDYSIIAVVGAVLGATIWIVASTVTAWRRTRTSILPGEDKR